VAEHHLVTLLPLAAAMTVLAALAAPRWAAIAVGLIYAACCFQWQTAAVAGLKRTGGSGPWSDGVVTLATRLKHDYAPLPASLGLCRSDRGRAGHAAPGGERQALYSGSTIGGPAGRFLSHRDGVALDPAAVRHPVGCASAPRRPCDTAER